MPRPMVFSASVSAEDDNKFAESQTPAAGGAQALTLTSSLTNTYAQHILVTCAGADAARTFTVVGTDRYGNAITEVIAGSNGGTTTGTKNFASVTSVTVDDDTAGAVEVGIAASGEGPWIPLNWRGGDIGVVCEISGSPNYGLELTNDDVQAAGFLEDDAPAIQHATLTNESTNQLGAITEPFRACRLELNAAGTVTATLVQAFA